MSFMKAYVSTVTASNVLTYEKPTADCGRERGAHSQLCELVNRLIAPSGRLYDRLAHYAFH